MSSSSASPRPSCPAWKTEYPIRQSAEHGASRRSFAKLLGVSLMAVAGGYVLKDRLFGTELTGPQRVVAQRNEVEVGDYKLFSYPDSEPCILIRLSADEYVAFSQSCTHLMCPVHYNHKKGQLVCPCHEGYFDARSGDVLAGPPPRPLPRYRTTLVGDDVVVG